MDALELREIIRKIAEGKIACECGNSDWEQFIYIGTPPLLFGGCKRCSASYKFDTGPHGAWPHWDKIADGTL